MTKRNDDMDVVEMDAIDHGDWETNMSTSELPVAGLAALVRQTAAAPVVERPPVHVAPTTMRPAVSPMHTPIPVRVPPTPSPSPEAIEEPVEQAPSLRPSRRILLIAAGSAAALGIIVGVIVVGGKHRTESAAAPVSAVASAPTAAPAPPPAPPAAAPSKPSHAKPAATKQPAIAAAPKPTVTKHPAIAAAPKPAAKPIATKRPATHAVHASHAPAAKKHVATRTQPPAPPPVEPDVLDRAHVAYNAGNEALFAGDTAAAIRSYEEVVGLSPTLAFGYRGLGLAYAQSGDSAAAIKALKRYLELAPHAKDAALIRKRLVGLQHSR